MLSSVTNEALKRFENKEAKGEKIYLKLWTRSSFETCKIVVAYQWVVNCRGNAQNVSLYVFILGDNTQMIVSRDKLCYILWKLRWELTDMLSTDEEGAIIMQYCNIWATLLHVFQHTRPLFPIFSYSNDFSTCILLSFTCVVIYI